MKHLSSGLVKHLVGLAWAKGSEALVSANSSRRDAFPVSWAARSAKAAHKWQADVSPLDPSPCGKDCAVSPSVRVALRSLEERGRPGCGYDGSASRPQERHVSGVRHFLFSR